MKLLVEEEEEETKIQSNYFQCWQAVKCLRSKYVNINFHDDRYKKGGLRFVLSRNKLIIWAPVKVDKQLNVASFIKVERMECMQCRT